MADALGHRRTGLFAHLASTSNRIRRAYARDQARPPSVRIERMTTPPHVPSYASSPSSVPAKPPGGLVAAFVLVLIEMGLLIVVGLIGLFGVFAGGAPLSSLLAEAGLGEPGLAGAIIGILASLIIGLLVVWGLQIFLAARMRAGANWARMTLTVFQSIGALFLLLSLFDPEADASSLVASLLLSAVSVVVIVLMFLPASNAYFAHR